MSQEDLVQWDRAYFDAGYYVPFVIHEDYLAGMYPMAASIVDAQFVAQQIKVGALLAEEAARVVKIAVEHEFCPKRAVEPTSYSFGFWLDRPEEFGEALDDFHATHTAYGWVSENDQPRLTEIWRREKDGRFAKAKRIVFKVLAQRK